MSKFISFVGKLTLILVISGCSKTNSEREIYFHENISKLISNKDSVVISAGELTNFSWEKLCFERNGKVNLRFHVKRETVIFHLSFEKYFIDEGYVDASPSGKCLTRNNKLQIRTKYPDSSKIIEISIAD